MKLFKKISQWRSTRKGTSSSTAEPNSPSNSVIISNVLYRNISNLPLNVFISCYVDQNLSALIISGNPTDEELLEAWDSLKQQYADAIGDHEHRLRTSLFTELTIMKTNYAKVMMLIDLLEKAFYQPLVDELNDMLQTTFVFDPNNPAEYRHLLHRCIKRSKSILLELELKQKQYLSIIGTKPGEAVKPTNEYFQSILITLSDHAKFAIQDNISVYEFCERLKRYNHYVEEVKRLNRK